jgi:hypothetical protein
LHEASSDGVTWFTPPYYPTSASLDVLGGSDTDWQQAAGGSTDVRRFLSFWGSKSAGQTAGCCSSSPTIEQTIAATYSSEPFTMTFYFGDDATATPSTKLLPYVKAIATDINLTLAVEVTQLGGTGVGTGFVSAVSDWVFSTAGLTSDDVDEIRVDRLMNGEDGNEVLIIRVQIRIKESSGVERAHVCLNAQRTTTLASGGGAGGDEPIDIAVSNEHVVRFSAWQAAAHVTKITVVTFFVKPTLALTSALDCLQAVVANSTNPRFPFDPHRWPMFPHRLRRSFGSTTIASSRCLRSGYRRS